MKLKKFLAGLAAVTMVASCAISAGNSFVYYDTPVYAASALDTSSNLGEAAYITWAPVSGADGYNVYVDGVQIDSMLVRQYSGYFRADAVGLKAGSHTMKVVPTSAGTELTSEAFSQTVTVKAHDRSGYAFANGKALGAYNADGTLKSDAVVVYVTNENKDTVTCELNAEGKGNVTCTGVQNIITAYKKGKETRPIAIRFIGNIEDPANISKGDLYVDSATAGMTLEGIGNDATLNGFGLILKNCSNVEVRNLGFMNCNSEEGDNCGLQQGNTYCWVHNCDFFYGDAGTDSDQAKGDGALDTKKSQYITHSYNHFYDSGKCNLQGANSSDTSNYITYHHNWYDHSDSRHPRVRVAQVHVYNNYYDGNSKYGIGSTTDSDVFAENNYFRNCKVPMMISMQGSDTTKTLSEEDGGIIKAYGNEIVGATNYTPYSKSSTSFDCYDASSRNEQVPSSVKAAQGGATYNNFDTASDMYSYTVDAAADVPAIVEANAGRVDGGDFKWEFNDSVDDTDSEVNTALKAAIVAYDDSIIAIGSGFDADNDEPVTTEPVTTEPVTTTTKATEATTTTTTTKTTTTKATTANTPVVADAIYCSPDASSSGAGTKDDPIDVKSALTKVKAGGTIYLLGGTYKFSEQLTIEESNSGTAGAMKTIRAYPGADVYFDFSGQGAANSSVRGFVLDGSYWHFYGFEIAKAADNGMLLSGDNNLIEMMVFTDNQDTGLQLSRFQTAYSTVAQWPSNNTILNCTSKNNCDDATMENADGFAAKLTCGEGNVFDGCMAYNNSDDGWDLYAKEETGPIGVVTIRNCAAFRNGFTEYGEGFGDCDGNGFKLGGAGVGSAHVVENCIAFENLNCGFTDNNNPKLATITNCTAYNNDIDGNGKPNFSCYRCTDDGCDFSNVITYMNSDRLSASFPGGESAFKATNDKFVGTMENSIYYNGSKYYYVTDKTAIDNGDKIGTVVTNVNDDMFVSLEVAAYKTVSAGADSSYDFHSQWRNADGTINTNGFLEVKDSSEYSALGVNFANPAGDVNPPLTLQGDVNEDGDVNLTDIAALQKFLTKKSTTVTYAYDVNEDGKINVFDFVTLKRILIG
ncbi:MAG: silent information regulator protein Sir2 [Ruminococcus sp.]|nr:silent information regulator protein Sir2 [Ruminococcus sp.]